MSETGFPNTISDLDIVIVNFNEQSVVPITDLVQHFNIYESIFNQYVTCDLILADAAHLLSRLPIVGEEFVVIKYKSSGLKGTEGQEPYTLRTRSFKIYKLSDRNEFNEGTSTYRLHGIDDHYFINEAHSVNQSYVGSNCIAACENIFKSYFIDPIILRPFDKQKFNLVNNGTEITKKKYETTLTKQSTNNSNFISPGLTPIEVINYLKSEAVHKSSNDTSNYMFFQNLNGHHLLTMSELKAGDASFTYFLKNVQVEAVGKKEEKEMDETTTSERNSILSFKFRKNFDTLNNIQSGMYGNRVVAIDLLTKKFDERIFTYDTEWPRLTPLESGPNAASLMSDAEQNVYRSIGSTQTRFIVSDLISNSIPTGNPTQFSGNEHPSYKQTPYFYPIDKEDPDLMRDKLTGTLKNEDAKYKMVALVRDDPKLKNPKTRHLKMNREVAQMSSLDSIVLDLTVPGNSDIQAGQVIHVFIPDEVEKAKYISALGQSEPRMLVTDVRQGYLKSSSAYITTLTCIKDCLNTSVEKQFEAGLND